MGRGAPPKVMLTRGSCGHSASLGAFPALTRLLPQASGCAKSRDGEGSLHCPGFVSQEGREGRTEDGWDIQEAFLEVGPGQGPRGGKGGRDWEAVWWAQPLPPPGCFLQGELEPPEPIHVGDLGECFYPVPTTAASVGPESFLCEMEAVPFNPVQSWLKHESSPGKGHTLVPRQVTGWVLSSMSSGKNEMVRSL